MPFKTVIATSVVGAYGLGDSRSELPGRTHLRPCWHTLLCGERRDMQGVHV